MFKQNLNEVSRGRNESEKQKIALENIKLLHRSQETVIKLFNDYPSIVLEAKYKTIHGKGIPTMLAQIARVVKVTDHSNLKICSPKQMLQRLPITLGQVKAGDTSENLLNKIRQVIYSLYHAKEFIKKASNNIINLIKL